MKIKKYFISGPCKPLCKQWSIMGRAERQNEYFPLVFLQRPKWIKSDAAWEKICNSIQLKLPTNVEIE